MKSKAANASQKNQPQLDGAASLAELALNLHWTWNHATDELWQRLDAELWQATQNPWVVLQTISKDTLNAALAEPEFRRRLDDVLTHNRQAYADDAWFQAGARAGKLSSVAYFSMEFMLSEALPIYSGGLGQVAGDQMKAASDLGVPVTGIGLLYGQGYFRQAFDTDGRQLGGSRQSDVLGHGAGPATGVGLHGPCRTPARTSFGAARSRWHPLGTVSKIYPGSATAPLDNQIHQRKTIPRGVVLVRTADSSASLRMTTKGAALAF